MEHTVKIESKYLARILEGVKMFEVRKNDRDYQVGDILHFKEVRDDDLCKDYSQRRRISYIHRGVGMQEGYVVLGISDIHSEQ